MSFDDDRIKDEVAAEGNVWTSYSDLFMVLSSVFLLLYVVSTLRQATVDIRAKLQIQAAEQELKNYKDQVSAYEQAQEEYAGTHATEEEKAAYDKVLSQMTLLETDAKSKKEEALRIADEQGRKEKQLNEYQALVKSVINANMLAQKELKKKSGIIADRERNILDLSKTVATNEKLIEQNEAQINKIQTDLEEKIKEAKYAYRSKERSKKRLETVIADLKSESEAKIQELNYQRAEVSGKLEKAQFDLQKKNNQQMALLAKLDDRERQFKSSMDELRRTRDQAMLQERAQSEEKIRKLALTAQKREEEEKELRGRIARAQAQYEAQVQELNQRIGDVQGEKQSVEAKYQQTLDNLAKTSRILQAKEKEDQSRLAQKKAISDRIRNAFKSSGVSAQIDEATGEVSIDFRNEYFDYGKSHLKTGMIQLLQTAIPAYAQGVFGDSKLASRISSVEIVGFASPTYKGKYVDPNTLDGTSRKAVNYNMDLSYQRAKAIFEHVFDVNKMQFSYQNELLKTVRVTGRSFLASQTSSRNVANASDGFCTTYDCRKSQKVVIKFNLKDQP